MTTTRRPRGRPRSLDIDERVLARTREILGREGYAGVSMDRIAAEAGVGRQSLYRRWPRKPLLVFDALWGGAEEMDAILPDTGSLRGDLEQQAVLVTATYATPMLRDTARQLLADSLAQPEVLDELRRRFVWPRLTVVERIIERARERGEVGPDVSAATVAESVLGATIGHFLVVGRENEGFMRELVELVHQGLTGDNPSAR